MLKLAQMVNMVTMLPKNVKNAQKIVQLAMDQLMINVILVNQNGSYTKVNVSILAQMAIMD